MNKAKSNVAALTGAIATGKSVVSNYLLKNFGFVVIDADKIGHEVLEDTDIIGIIREEFGETVIREGAVNREKLGRIVFSDPSKLMLLNSIVHPRLFSKAQQMIEAIPSSRPVIFEAAVLIEAGWHKYFDKIIITTCSPDIQIKRIVARDGISEADALKIIASQISYDERYAFADYIVDTSEGLENITVSLDEIANDLISQKEV
jgi:dephospho-CoA kinase